MSNAPFRQPFRPLVRSQADLERLWRRLMGPLGFEGHTVWMVQIEGDRPLPQIIEIVEAGRPPSEVGIESLAELLAGEAGPGQRFAFLRSRPGGGGPDADDVAWALALQDAGRRAGVAVDVVHLAHDHDVLPISPDDLIAATA